MQKLRLDDLRVDSFATDEAASSDAVITATVPYSLLGSCYGCTVGDATITICPATYAVAQ